MAHKEKPPGDHPETSKERREREKDTNLPQRKDGGTTGSPKRHPGADDQGPKRKPKEPEPEEELDFD